MAESAFTVTYDGPALATGRIPVRDLAPALLALGELFLDASSLVNPDREPVPAQPELIEVDVPESVGRYHQVRLLLTPLSPAAICVGRPPVPSDGVSRNDRLPTKGRGTPKSAGSALATRVENL